MGMMIHRRREGHLHYPTVEKKTMEQPKVDVSKVEPEKKVEKKEVVFTLEEINKLPFFSLKKVASSEGIDVTGKKTADLRAALIKKLGL